METLTKFGLDFMLYKEYLVDKDLERDIAKITNDYQFVYIQQNWNYRKGTAVFWKYTVWVVPKKL